MSTRRLAYAVLSVGVVLVVVTYLLGEFIAPPAERLGHQSKLVATGSTLMRGFMGQPRTWGVRASKTF